MNRRDELYHYGIPGMRWGKRRVKADYQTDPNNPNGAPQKKRSKLKTALKVGAGLAVAAGAAYGAKKLYDARRNKSIQTFTDKKQQDLYRRGYKRAKTLRQQRDPNVFKNTVRNATDKFYNDIANRKAKYKTPRFRDSVNDFYYSVARKRGYL